MHKHVIIRNKRKISRVLKDDPYLAQYVPHTSWFSIKALRRKLKKHRVVYVKPNDGLKGEGIIRVRSLPDKRYEVSYGRKVRRFDYEGMVQKVLQQISGKGDYIIQQGIELATFNGRPYDIRLLLVKHLDRWHLTMITGKVAAHKDAVVTNVSYNRKVLRQEDLDLEYPISKILYETDGNLRPIATLRELMDVSYQIANTLGRRFPFYILGLDLALDKQGKIWFFEANTSPAIKPMKKTNDRKKYKIVVEAKKHIEMVPPR